MMGTNPVLEAALAYIDQTWSVLPFFEPRDGGCSCSLGKDCRSAGKHPRLARGINGASADQATIRKWFKGTPSSNVAIATGNGLAVVDVDPRNGGTDQLKQLCARFDYAPTGPQVETGGGGAHLYFASTGKVRSRQVAPGVELKAEGSCVIAPPSLHVSGARYKWAVPVESQPLPALPSWLVKASGGKSVEGAGESSLFLEGTRHKMLLRTAGALRRVGAPLETIYAALQSESQRCVPPLPDAELRQIAVSICKYPSGGPSDSSGYSAQSLSPIGGDWAESKSLKFVNGAEFAKQLPHEADWIAKPWVAAGAITELNGRVKTAGKTTFITHLMRAVIEGALFLGERTRRTPVVLLTEQPRSSLRASLARAGLLGREEISMLTFGDTFGFDWSAISAAAITECVRIGACLLVVDTLTQFTGVQGDRENSAGDALAAMLPVQRATNHDIGVLLSRHERKAGGEVGDSGRGSSAYAGAVDTVITLRRPKGSSRPTLRILQALSRFDEVPRELTIELTPDGYKSLGQVNRIPEAETKSKVLVILQERTSDGATEAELVEQRSGTRTTVQRALHQLEEDGAVGHRGKGSKGQPRRYYAKVFLPVEPQ
jgi:hypothetical protein